MRHLPALALLAVIVSLSTGPAGAVEELPGIRVRVEAPDKARLQALMESDLDLHHFHGMGSEALVNRAQLDELRAQGYRVLVEDADVRAVRRGGGFLPEYISYSEAVAELNALAAAHPTLTELSSIGQSIEGREQWVLKISDNASVDEDEPEVLIYGNHHAREVISVIIPLHVAATLLDDYGSDPDITEWVNEREIWILPVLNPDGYVYVETTDLFWRKNRRGGYGVDLNRNYDAEWGHDNNGS
ncbi:MAG TPA: M14 family zinc carboxypeptidase, partial [bacterium]|nr:M14 family zinc carboxypeptidase [bacterium]